MKVFIFLWVLLLVSQSVLAEKISVQYSGESKAQNAQEKFLYLKLYSVDPVKGRSWDDQRVEGVKKLLYSDFLENGVSFDLGDGLYALRGFLDITGDGDLNKNGSGRPSEPVGFSLGDGQKKVHWALKRSTFSVSGKARNVMFSLLAKKNGNGG